MAHSLGIGHRTSDIGHRKSEIGNRESEIGYRKSERRLGTLKKLRAGKHAGRRICHTPTTTRAKWPKNFGMPDAIAPFMPKSRNLHERAFRFVVDVIALCRIVIARDALLRQVAWQLIDAAGSTGANTEEAAEGQSKADFIAKNCIALKEAREARYWLRVIAASEPASSARASELASEASELVAMLVASINTAKSNPHRGRRHLNDESDRL
jgi:four helix bundle protein